MKEAKGRVFCFGENVDTDVIIPARYLASSEPEVLAAHCMEDIDASFAIAPTFARIFYRNAINIGLPIVECAEAAKEIREGDTVSVDFESGMITDETTGKTYRGQAFPPFMQKIIDAGGLIHYVNSK